MAEPFTCNRSRIEAPLRIVLERKDTVDPLPRALLRFGLLVVRAPRCGSPGYNFVLDRIHEISVKLKSKDKSVANPHHAMSGVLSDELRIMGGQKDQDQVPCYRGLR